MNAERFASQIAEQLSPFETNRALRILHFAARIITHRKAVGLAVPWAFGVQGEPDAGERQLAERLVHSAEAMVGGKVNEWSDDIAASTIAQLAEYALTLPSTQSESDRVRAREFLTLCRRESSQWKRDWSSDSLGVSWWSTWNSLRRPTELRHTRTEHSLFLASSLAGSYQGVLHFLRRLSVNVITQAEVPSRDRSVIESLEEHVARVRFAVGVLSADDAVVASAHLQTRPNLLFELGYLWGRLGRQNLFLLVEPGVRFPSNLNGLLYHELDERKLWQQQLTAELRVAGFDVDFSDADRAPNSHEEPG